MNNFFEDIVSLISEEEDLYEVNSGYRSADGYEFSKRHLEFSSDWDEDDIFFDEDYYNKFY